MENRFFSQTQRLNEACNGVVSFFKETLYLLVNSSRGVFTKIKVVAGSLLYFLMLTNTLNGQVGNGSIMVDSTIYFCGTEPHYISDMNVNYRISEGGGGIGLHTQQEFEDDAPSAIYVCGKFRVYYEDIYEVVVNNVNAEGFAAPGLITNSNSGEARRNTLCEVLSYVESIFDIKADGVNDFIDIHIRRSYSTSFPAPANTGFLAQAGTLYPQSFNSTQGVYNGYTFDHITTGVDPESGIYDAHIQVNFDMVSNNPIDYYTTNGGTTIGSNNSFDLFSVLLHETGHAMGILSSVEMTAGNLNPHCSNNNSAYSLYDWLFLYKGDIGNPVSFNNGKVLTGSVTNPQINPLIVYPNSLMEKNLWVIWNLDNTPLNPANFLDNHYHATYCGVSGLFSGNNYTFQNPNQTVSYSSYIAHLNMGYNSFQDMVQFSPGFQPRYVMGPSILSDNFKRDWTLAEIRLFLGMHDIVNPAQAYTLNPTFAGLSTLSLDGLTNNDDLLYNNFPPLRLNTNEKITTALISGNPPNSPDPFFAETGNPGGFTFTISMNDNTLLSSPTTLDIDINAFTGLIDDKNDGLSAAQILDNSLFNIRGCGTNGNNHDRLVIDNNLNKIIFTPEAGYIGLAQFGFHLTDGKEKGSLIIITIDVQNSSYIPNLGDELVINGGYEEGTEVKQYSPIVYKDKPYSTRYQDGLEGEFMNGAHFSGGHVVNYQTDGSFTPSLNVYRFNGSKIARAGKRFDLSDWMRFGLSHYNTCDFSPPISSYPDPLIGIASNERYQYEGRFTSFSTLIEPVEECKFYEFSCDVAIPDDPNWYTSGGDFKFYLDFCENPASYLDVVNISLVPTVTGTGNEIPVTLHNIQLCPGESSIWQHATIKFPYCGVDTRFFKVEGEMIIPDVYLGAYFDNLSLKEINAPEIEFTSQNLGSCTPTLTATIGINASACNYTFSWNINGTVVTNTGNVLEDGIASVISLPLGLTNIPVTLTFHYGGNCSIQQSITIPSTQLTNVISPLGPNTQIFVTDLDESLFVNNLNPVNFTADLVIDGNPINFNPANGIGTLNILNSHIIMHPGTAIHLEEGKVLLVDNSQITGCNQMWRGIFVDAKEKVYTQNETIIEDAETALNLSNLSHIYLKDTRFNKNMVSIYSEAPTSPPAYLNTLYHSFSGCTFDGSGTFLPPYPGQVFLPGYRPVIGVELRNVDLFEIKSPNSANVFQNLNIGAATIRTNLNVKNALFTDISPSGATGLFGVFKGQIFADGSAIAFHGHNIFSLNTQGGNLYGGVTDMLNCQTGINVFSAFNVECTNHIMDEVNWGMYVLESEDNKIWLSQNRITYKGMGIGLFHNDSQKNKLYVIYNELQPVASPLSGATAILVAGTAISRDYYATINHNIIQTGWGLNGIVLQKVMKYQLADNDIEMGNNALNDYGISVEGCNRIQVNCNHVHYNTNGQPPAPCYDGNGFVVAPFDAIHAIQSVGCSYHCNTTEGTCNGLRFNMNCSGSTVEANVIGNHATGLYLDANAVIGEQPVVIDPNTPLNGNRWVGSYVNNPNALGARNWNTGGQVASEFTVNSAVDASHMPTLDLSNFAWFDNVNDNLQYLNYVSCNQAACEGYTGNEAGFSEGQRAIAEGNLPFDSYETENNRWYDRVLFEFMQKYPNQWDGDSTFQTFYDSVMLTLMPPLVALQTGRENITNTQTAVSEYGIIMDSLIEQIVYYDSLYRDATPLDTAAIDEMLRDLHFSLGNVLAIASQQIESDHALLYNQSDQLYAQNFSLTPADSHQEYEQVVNEIYFRTFSKHQFLLDSVDKVVLEEVASLCPVVGGPAVFMARGMTAIYGLTVYLDEENCLSQGYSLRQTAPTSPPLTEAYPETIKVYPNPTSGDLYIHVPDRLCIGESFQLYDATQRMVFCYFLQAEEHEYEIKLPAVLPNGIYFYSVGKDKGKLILNR